MIAVIDKTSAVRHACHETLSAAGQDVSVFHSPESFVNSHVLYNADLLILGQTRVGIHQSEAILWACAVRPELQTFRLHPRCREIQNLSNLCNETDSHWRAQDSRACIEALKAALDSGFILIDRRVKLAAMANRASG
jgi:diketogulonate reductase-like aldo/keto reductase